MRIPRMKAERNVTEAVVSEKGVPVESFHHALGQASTTKAPLIDWIVENIPGVAALEGDDLRDTLGVQWNSERDAGYFLTSVVFSGVMSIFFLFSFCLFRWLYPTIYTREGASHEGISFLDWFHHSRNTEQEATIAAAGLDGFLFLKFYELNEMLFLILSCTLLVVLTPIHWYSSGIVWAKHNSENVADWLARIGIDLLRFESKELIWVHV